jgi:hypothetical protein
MQLQCEGRIRNQETGSQLVTNYFIYLFTAYKKILAVSQITYRQMA